MKITTGSLRASLGLGALAVIAGAGCFDGALAAEDAPKWWNNAVIYEIYPRSFQDSNGDGVGDLNGITQRLGYLESLGVDAIWIGPMFPSPQIDFGYDISDYQNVDPKFGTLKDFDRLIAEAQKHHLRVILDMVLNHTSDKHQWFLEASRSRDDPKHDYYVWHDGLKGTEPQPPNNWISIFGGSAWTYRPELKQFYYHKFYAEQPDLNWRNPDVERAMFNSMKFWLDRGVAGFRLDAITAMFEDPQMRDEPLAGGKNPFGDDNLRVIYTDNLPEVHDVMRRLRSMMDAYAGDRVIIGETYLPNTAELDKWYGGGQHDELQLPMDMLVGFVNKLDAPRFRQLLTELDTLRPGSQPMIVADNHDNARSWDRYGDGVHNADIAKLLATLMLTSRTTTLLYQGEEIGQRTAPPKRIEDVKDPIGVRGWPTEKGRDGERTPMQWDALPQAGFSTNPKTWLPVTGDYRTVNVKSEAADPRSLLNWHKRLISLKRQLPALKSGRLLMLDTDNPHVLSYARIAPSGEAVIIALNMSHTAQEISLKLAPEPGGVLRTVMANPAALATPTSLQRILLPAYGSWVGTR